MGATKGGGVCMRGGVRGRADGQGRHVTWRSAQRGGAASGRSLACTLNRKRKGKTHSPSALGTSCAQRALEREPASSQRRTAGMYGRGRRAACGSHEKGRRGVNQRGAEREGAWSGGAVRGVAVQGVAAWRRGGAASGRSRACACSTARYVHLFYNIFLVSMYIPLTPSSGRLTF